MAGEVKTVTIDVKVKDNFNKARQDFDQLNSSVDKGSKDMGNSMSNLNKSILGVGAAIGGAFAIKAVIGDAVNRILDFEKAMSSLSAITGVTGKGLEELKGKVLQVAGDTKKSATEVAKAFELIGSKAPKLLENADALAAVTKQAIILSKATGEDLVSSSGSLTGVLNQFNLEATESERIINALAAGSQKGAAPVAQISEAIDKFGTVANAANISVEQSIALTETLAEKNITGAEAGTQLRNIILKLQSANIGYTDGVFNLNDALQEVKDKNLSAAESAKLFGLESITAGNILVNNIGTIDKYTAAVTGTNTANEQAIIQTDNVKTKMEELDAIYEALILSFEGSDGVLSGVMGGFVDTIAEAVNGIILLNTSTEDLLKKVKDKSLNNLLEQGKKNAEETKKQYQEVGIEGDNLVESLKRAYEQTKQFASEAEKRGDKNLALTYKAEAIALNELINPTKGSTEAIDENTTATNTNNKSKEKTLTLLEKQLKAQSDFKKSLEGERGIQDESVDEESKYDEDLSKFTDAEFKKVEEKEEARRLDKENQDLLNAEIFEENMAAQDAKFENDAIIRELEEEEHQRKLQRNMEIGMAAADLAGVLSGLAKKGSVEAKALASTQVIINGAVAIVQALAQLGPIAGALAAAGIAITVGVQLNKISNAKTLKDGEIMIQGEGTETSDSIPAMLSKNESVINAKESKKHKVVLKAINEGGFDNWLNDYTAKQLYISKKREIKQISKANETKIVFPKGFQINNPSAISKPMVDALNEYAFLNQNGSWND